MGREDRRVGEAHRAQLAGGLAQGHDDGMGGRVVGLLDPVVGPGDHRLVDDGDRGDGPLAAFEGEPGLGQCLAHEQLVVHGPMLADGPLPTVAGGAIRYRNATDRARSER